MSDQNINIKLDRGPDNHAWTVLGTLLACGAAGMVAWVVSAAGMLDLAATGLTFFTQLLSMMFKVGLLVLPEKKSSDFSETSGLLKTAWREFQEFQAKSPIWRLAVLALGFTIVFMIARLGLSFALGVFGNIWIAGAAAALLASLIVAPNLFSGFFSRLKSKSGVQIKPRIDDEPESGKEAA
ncbi:hypothetical protein [Enemella evansiae]|uniref:Uncharacterized protein n=1 Tax=Enemella evansiae TaxID=2016499 RepID=A0A255GQ39_9ACTN|nr:hypothetical protein [Enemella evansiae]OYO14040.1 hypothetical protein BI335_12610 [Enemella evansiae]OYO17522.1 hypothetical protein CGZ94_01030 [Enemella evansiae]TDO89544.1 hypothetical protein C8D81_2417 [Enemella evansiae]